MTKINATIEIKNSDFLGIDTCGICPFQELRFDKNPIRCKIFNKELDRFNPVEELGVEHWEYRRLQECKDSEVE